MDRFSVDGSQLREHYGPGTILRDVFADIEEELRAEGKVVCRFIVNGMAIQEKEEERFAAYPLEDVEKLEYLSESMGVLADGVIAGWLDALPELQEGAERLARKLQSSPGQGYMRDFRDILENCEYLVSSLQSLSKLAPGMTEKTRSLFEEADRKTMGSLKEAIHYIEKKDLVQLAWTLEYDLSHALEIWKDALVGLHGADSDGASENSLVRVRSSH